ncbi:MAG: hypothetical protein ACOC05_08040 [Oceanicaulis sp.]
MDASPHSSAFTIEADPACGLVTVYFKGTVGRSDLVAAEHRLISVAEKMPVNAVLIDARHSQPAYSPSDLIASVEQSLQFVAPRRCAFVASPERSREVMLIETVSFPFAVRVRAFEEPSEARAWAIQA